jgi:hypothetical protein
MDAPEHLFDDRTPGVEEHEFTRQIARLPPDPDRLFRLADEVAAAWRYLQQSLPCGIR